jgi:alkylated DNA repair protein (DNA oxidative demethylase)
VTNPAAADVVFKKGFLSLAEQREVYEKVLHIDPGFYVPVLRTGAKMNLRMNCLGNHWSAVTYRYTKVRDVDGREVAPVPAFLQALARRAVRATGYWRGPGVVPDYDICIVNLYDEAVGKLGVHADNSESTESLAAGYPVVSLSIGASCVFTIGGLSRKDPQVAHVLDSGDLVLFGRSMRLAYHGVTKIIKDTTPPALGFKEPGRLNLTFRIW